MRRTLALAIASTSVALLALATGPAAAQSNPAGPVANGNFESFAVPSEATQPLQGTPADECVGIGHQVDYGTDTPQGTLTGSEFDDMPDDADPSPTALVDRYQQGGASQARADAEEQSGYGHCEFSDAKGEDKYWVNAAGAGGTTGDSAFLWSNVGDDGSPTQAGFTYDDDPFDKEVQVDTVPGKHNFWQNVLNPGREPAYTANFDALQFDVEAGSIPDEAYVDISLNGAPGHVQEPYVAAYIDCGISFPASYLQASLDEGTVSASPVADAVNYDAGADCPSKSNWNNPDDGDSRREILGRLSISQVSFWKFNRGDAPVVIDNIALPGATTLAQEAASGNARGCTDLDVRDTVDPVVCNNVGDV